MMLFAHFLVLVISLSLFIGQMLEFTLYSYDLVVRWLGPFFILGAPNLLLILICLYFF